MDAKPSKTIFAISSIARCGYQCSSTELSVVELEGPCDMTKRIIALFCALFAVAAIWIGWRFQPWMATGKTVRIGSKHMKSCEFQVWQRKNAAITEPFATGLFARVEGGPWKAFLLDFEDTYRPSILLRQNGSVVEVFRGSTRLGVFDVTQQLFRRDLDGGVFLGDRLDSEPPGSWWMKESGVRDKREGETDESPYNSSGWRIHRFCV